MARIALCESYRIEQTEDDVYLVTELVQDYDGFEAALEDVEEWRLL